MTRKQALHMALEALTDEAAKAKINEIINDMPLTNWTKEAIFDSVEQFILDNGRTPTATDFKKKGLPPHTVIKHRFGVSLSEFLNMYYPREKPKVNSKVYGHKSAEEWLEVFKGEFERIQPRSAEEYDRKRMAGTPCWSVIAKYSKVNSWFLLLKKSNVRFTNSLINKRLAYEEVKVVISKIIVLDEIMQFNSMQ